MSIRQSGKFGVPTMVGVAFLVLPAGIQGQGALDSNWLPWVGCWEGAAVAEGQASESLLVCFRPTGDVEGIESVTYSGGELLGREVLTAGSVATPFAEGGCEGTRRLEWSEDSRRLFLSSVIECGGGVARNTRGVFTFLQGGTGWSEILAIQAGDGPPLLEIRSFVPASAALLVESGITDPIVGIELAVNTARIRAGSSLSAETISELVSRAGATATGGLLVERGESFDPDASMLRTLARNGVPGEILDLVVALSYPERFQIAGSSAVAVESPSPTRNALALSEQRPLAPWGASPRAYYSPWGGGYYWYGYGMDRYGYDGFTNPSFYGSPQYYGYGYQYRYGNVYATPRYIVVQPPVVVQPGASIPPVRVDRDGGYSGGTSTRVDAPAVPRTSRPREDSQAPEAERTPAASSGSGSSGSSDSSGSTVRRAIPRPETD